MHGMLNGMEFSLSVLNGIPPNYADAPEIFISDLKLLDKFNNSSIIVHNPNKSDDNETD
jgi:hypothetical protein